MLPVSGAWQFIASGASSLLQPDSSAIGAYSSWVSPDSEGRKRFHRPRSRALTFSSSITGGTVWSSGPTCCAVGVVRRLGREHLVAHEVDELRRAARLPWPTGAG